MNSFNIIMDALESHAGNFPIYQDAIELLKCPACGMSLLQKGGWIFCPKYSTGIPVCDSLYHIAKNIKTGRGFCTTWNHNTTG